jgi:hypothetical protein
MLARDPGHFTAHNGLTKAIGSIVKNQQLATEVTRRSAD